MITSGQIHATEYDPSAKRWIVKFQIPTGHRTAVSKHIVMATGIGSQKMNIPSIGDDHLYKGKDLHSAQFKNAERLKDNGVKVSEVPIGKMLNRR